MTVVGYICVLVALVWILYKVYLSYASYGGTVMVTVYDAAIFPPLVGVFGLYWVLRSLEIDFAIWIYALLVVGLVVLVIIAIRVAEEIGDRRRP